MFSIPAPLILAFITIYAGIRLMLRGMSAPVVVAMGIIPGQTRIGLWQWGVQDPAGHGQPLPTPSSP